MELPAVFDHAHRLVSRFLRDGTVDGLRIDHIDGLLDPKGYLERLRARAPARPGQEPFYLVVEKILAPHEPLRADWPVDGTTGYEVTNQLLDLLIDPAGETDLSRIYADFTRETEPFAKILRASKKRIMDNEMSSELNSLARDVVRIARRNRSTSDFTRNLLRRALREIVANFPVYRTYVDFDNKPNEDDRRYLDEAIAGARKTETAIDGSVFTFLRSLLGGDLVAGPKSGLSPSAVLRTAMRFQQYSGPVMAKGLEDTAFYRFNRFIALNEVGGHPTSFGRPMSEFHDANVTRARDWPHAMLGTSTHDTKRGEDARARLAVISEVAEDWARAVTAWEQALRDAPDDPDIGPDRNERYAMYQLLVGTCPVELFGPGSPDATTLDAYAERLKATMTKSMREARVNSTWSEPNATYEAGTLAFVDHALKGAASTQFLPAFLPFAERIARLGAANSIVQTVLKLTMPGVPDLYQGTELWDLTMVDPDNRRPVDFDHRTALLDQVLDDLERDRSGAMADYARTWPDGRVKLALTASLLGLRRAYAPLFAAGDYEPLMAEGPGRDDVCAFTRHHGDDTILVAVARFPARRDGTGFDADTRIALPDGTWRDALTDRSFRSADRQGVETLFSILPAAVLIREH